MAKPLRVWSGSNWVLVSGVSASGTPFNIPNTLISRSASGSFNISAIDLDTTASPALSVGRIQWNPNFGTPEVGLVGGNVTAHIGQHVHAYVTNDEGSPLVKGDVVYLYGASGDRASVKKASNISDTTSSKTLGIAAEAIGIGQNGFVTVFGVVDKLDLSNYSSGDVLWLSASAGKFTKIKPSAPQHLVFIGVVARANPGNGQLFVNVQNGYELEELHSVTLTNVTDNDILAYNGSSSLWFNQNLATAIQEVDGAGSGIDADLLDGQQGSYYLDWTNTTNKPDPIIGVNLTGNTTAAASVTLTDLTNGQISLVTNTNFATSASSINWIGVTNKPDPIIGVNLTGNTTGAASVTLTDLASGQISITTNTAHSLTASSIAGSLVTGTVANATIASTLTSSDTRSASTTPETTGALLRVDFKQNSTENLSDGGIYFGELTFRPYGTGTDWSGGAAHQLGFTNNGNIWFRYGVSTTWSSWRKIWHDANDGASSGLDADLLDGQQGSYYLDSNNFTNKPDPVIGVSLTGNTTGAASATLTDLTNGQISIITNTNFSTSASSINWVGVTGRPTTLSGYGITDAIPVSASQAYLTRSDAVIIYAPLASASLTGIPVAPTASSGTNTKQIATTEFVRTEVANLIASAPATLDTLNELAAALGNDPNYAASTASVLANKLNAETASTLYMTVGSTANHATSASSINWNGVTNRPDPIIGVSLSGNTSGAASVTLTDLTNGQISITTNTTHAGTASSIAGSLVTGIVNNANQANTASSINWTGVTAKPNLVNSVTGGSGITIGGTNSDPTVSLNAGASVSWGNVSSKPSPIVGVELLGDVTGAASATLSQLANGQISINTTVAANAVALGTDTTGNYVAGVTGGNGISITGAAGEGWSPTIAINSSASVDWGNVSNKPDPVIGVSLSGNTTGAASVTLTDLTNGQISITTNTAHAGTASSIAGSLVTGTVANATHAATASSISGFLVTGPVASANFALFANTASSIAGSLVTGTVNNASHSNTASSINSSLITGTVLPSNIVNSSLTSVGALGSLTVSGNLTVDTDTLFIDSINNRVGIRTTSPSATLHINATSTTAPSLTWGANSGQILRNENSELAIGLSNSSPFPLYFQGRTNTNTSRQIVLQPLGGNVGIGGDPSRTFTVVGTASFTGDISAPTFSGLLLGNAQTASSINISGVTGLASNISTFLQTPTSANLAAAITDESGTAGAVAFTNNPTFTGTLNAQTIDATNGILVEAYTQNNINLRTDGGFFQTSIATTASGWPQTTNSWYHLISSTHSNTGNYYSMQFAGSFYDSNALFYRATNGSGATSWNQVWHSGNISAASVSWGNVSNKPSPIVAVNLTGNTTGAASVTLSQLNSGQITLTTNTAFANSASSIDWSLITNRPSASPALNPQIGVNLTGDITGAASATLTSLANGQITISTTVAPDSVALGTDTTGNYVSGITGGNGITVTGAAGEGWSPTIAINSSASVDWGNVSNKPDPIVGVSLTGAITGAASATLTDLTNGQISVTTSYGAISTNAQTGTSYTLALSDAGNIIEMNNAAANLVVIPLNSTVAFPTGTKIDIIQTGAGATSASIVSGVTLNSEAGKRTVNAQWQAATLVKRGSDTWVMIGAIKA